MKVSKKAYYGLRAVVALAQANKALSIHTLAEAEKLPEDYLEKIFQSLRRSGIVEAKKGTAGGYTLARAAKNVNVWEILCELDGPIKTFAPLKGALPCLHVSHCQTNQVWRKLEDEIEKTLSKIKISDLTNVKFKTKSSSVIPVKLVLVKAGNGNPEFTKLILPKVNTRGTWIPAAVYPRKD